MKTKVYIVEDSEAIKKRIFRLLSNIENILICGWCDNRDTAISEIECTEPDVVVLDISIKESDGITMIQEIKRCFPSTKVVMFTNFDIENYKVEAFRLGADYYLDKSSEFIQLAEILQNNVN